MQVKIKTEHHFDVEIIIENMQAKTGNIYIFVHKLE